MIDLSPRLSAAFDDDGDGLHVLIVRFGAMGDILRTLPAVRLVKRRLPRARLGWVCDAGWEILLRDHPDIDLTLPLPRKKWDEASSSPLRWPALAGHVLAFRRVVAAFGADVTLDFHGNFRSGWIDRWSGAEIRLGYSGHQQKEGNHRFTTHRVPAGERRRSRIERNLDLSEALGAGREPFPPSGLTLPVAGRDEASRIAESLGERYAVLSPSVSAKQAYKTPPVELFAAAVAELSTRGIRTLVVWGPGEEGDAERALAACGAAAAMAPPTRLPVLAALVERATVVLAGDTGPMHLGCALQRPVLAFYGPTDPEVNRPWGGPYRRVFPPERDYTGIKKIDRQKGFEGLTPQWVRQQTAALLDEIECG